MEAVVNLRVREWEERVRHWGAEFEYTFDIRARKIEARIAGHWAKHISKPPVEARPAESRYAV